MSDKLYVTKYKDNISLLDKDSGSIFSISQKHLDILKGKKVDNSNHYAYQELKETGLFDGKINMNYSSLDDEVFHVQWHLTNRCNLKCAHCYQPNQDYSKEMNLDTLKNVFNKIHAYAKKYNSQLMISLTGGEPLVSSTFFDLLEYIKKVDERTIVYVLTNGTLINEEFCQQIIRLNVAAVQISLDGHNNEVHDLIRGNGNFDKAVSGIRLLKKSNVSVSTHFVIMEKNKESIIEFLDLCKNENLDRVTLSRYIPFMIASNDTNIVRPIELKGILNQINDYSRVNPELYINKSRSLWHLVNEEYGSSCPVGVNTITLLPDGTVLPCRRYPIKIGNLIHDDLNLMMFASKFMNDFREMNIEECNSCETYDRCKGGCQGLAFMHTGLVNTNGDPQCWKLHDTPLVVDFSHDYKYVPEYGYYVNSYSQLLRNELEVL